MSAEQLDISMEKDMGEWSSKMKFVYENKLAITHTLCINKDECPVNAAVLITAMPNIPVDQWQQCFIQISSDIIGDILQYLYTCEITVSLATLKEVLLASKVLKLVHLQAACEQFLMENLCPENYIGWYNFCTQEHFDNIAQYFRDKIVKELNKVRQCNEFQGLSFAEVNDFIKEHVENADTQFYAMMTWVLGHEERYGQVEELIKFIDLEKCSRKCLKKTIQTPYKEVLWTVSLQHKLLQASLENCGLADTGDEEYKAYQDEKGETTLSLIGLSFKSNMDFAKYMVLTYQSFKMTNTNTDVVIQLSDGEINAHQVVLATASPYFEALIRILPDCKDNAESHPSIMKTELSDLDAATVRALLDFMYTDKILIDDSLLLGYIHTCDFLQLDKLLDQCKQHAEDGIRMTPENCYQWIIGSNLFTLPMTRNRAVEFVCKNFHIVHKLDDIVTLGHKDMLDLLNNDALGSIHEQTLYDALMCWITYKHEDRRRYLNTFLESKAMAFCIIDQSLDMKQALQVGKFNPTEREQICEPRFTRLATVSPIYTFYLSPVFEKRR